MRYYASMTLQPLNQGGSPLRFALPGPVPAVRADELEHRVSPSLPWTDRLTVRCDVDVPDGLLREDAERDARSAVAKRIADELAQFAGLMVRRSRASGSEKFRMEVLVDGRSAVAEAAVDDLFLRGADVGDVAEFVLRDLLFSVARTIAAEVELVAA